jgi:hypothetical protein
LSNRGIQFQKFQQIHIKICTKESFGEGLVAENPFIRPLFCQEERNETKMQPAKMRRTKEKIEANQAQSMKTKNSKIYST